MDSGELVSQGYDPNVTFDNINLPVASISVNCDNSAMDAVGQVFYRSSDESFSESRSVVYNTSLHDPIILVLNPSFFEKKIISSLRLDLTNVSGDKIVCGEFVVNPQVVYNLDVTRLVVYVGFFLAIVLYLFRNIYMGFFLHTKYEEKITYFIVIEILQVVLFKSLNVPLNDQYVVLKLIILTAVSLSLSFSLSYIDFSRFFSTVELGSSKKESGGLLFIILVVVTYFPVISTTFFHHDDYLNYTGLFQNIFPASVGTGRIGAGLYVDMLYKLTVETSYIGRIVALSESC
ncbi:MAG: hypothetical protein IPN58_15800 [Anaerolineales bacterium]|nr:hypothetical protein [Anaerolineales bacterium]